MRSLLFVCLLVAPVLAAPESPRFATGYVFEDQNDNGRRDVGEPGITDVRVSNGREIVKTDGGGAYRLPVDDDTILFVIKPRDWTTPVDALNLPRFYYIHKPAGSPELRYPGVKPTGPLPKSVDFPLRRSPEPGKFDVVIFGDTQPRNIEEVEYFAHDVVEEVIGTKAAFGMTLGDIVFDRLDMFKPLNEAVALIGFRFHNVLGNHDIDFQSPDDEHSDEVFERHYGPPYYSFDYGDVHFIVLDDVMWTGATKEKKGFYRGGLGERQLEFVRNDLELVPDDKLVVVTMHIPIMEIAERETLYRLLAEKPHTVSFSAHWHVHRQWFLTGKEGWPGEKPHHHTTFVTACGSWWSGAPDEVGIPHTTMRDGGPNGWCTVTFDGTDYKVRFKAARRPANYQMNIFAPEAVAPDATSDAEVVANVFVASERAKVEMRVAGGEWQTMRYERRPDPYYLEMKKLEESDTPPPGRKLPKTEISTHIWVADLPEELAEGTHLIEVRAKDMYGQVHTGRRIIRVEK